MSTDRAICEEIANGSPAALQSVIDRIPSEVVATSAVVVCQQAFG